MYTINFQFIFSVHIKRWINQDKAKNASIMFDNIEAENAF